MSCFSAVTAVSSRDGGGKSKLTGRSDAVTGQDSGLGGSSSSTRRTLLESRGCVFGPSKNPKGVHFIYNETPTLCLLLYKKINESLRRQ